MLVKKFTLLTDDMWLEYILNHIVAHVNPDEVFQLLDEEEVELCDDCQVYLTKTDGEVVMDVYRCPDQQEFCLNCCGCPDHENGVWE